MSGSTVAGGNDILFIKGDGLSEARRSSVQESKQQSPDLQKGVSDKELKIIVTRIAKRLQKLKQQYPHFNTYDAETVVFPNSIYYSHNVRYRPNPRYEELLKEIEREPLRKLPAPQKEIPYFPEEDGIEVRVQFTSEEEVRTMARVVSPLFWIGDCAVEINVDGANTRETTEIREFIYTVVEEESKLFEDTWGISRKTKKEATSVHEEVSFESEYFRVSAGKYAPLSVGPGRDTLNIADLRASLKEWKSKADPILEKIREALEKEMKGIRQRLRLPLLRYSPTNWVVFETDIPEFVETDHYGLKREPFGYAMRFEKHDILVTVVFSKVPKRSIREQLRKRLESALEGVPTIPELNGERGKRYTDMLMELFGDYEPKRTPDTVFDYLQTREGLKACESILRNIPAGELGKLSELLVLFDEYAEKVQRNAGRYVEGNLLLGASKNQYEPSGEELVFAEIGSRIKRIVNSTQKIELKQYLRGKGITRKDIEYRSFTFTHADVMGSGRFFYASSPIKETVSFE